MNRLYKTFLLLAFVLMSSSTFAQKLSVESIEAKAGEQATMRVNISQPSETTVLQFCLQLPAGVTVNESGCAVGTAAANHTLSVNRMDSGDYLFVFYNLDFQQFTGGTLLTIPVTMAADAKTGNGTLYTVRSAKQDAVSRQLAASDFTITVKGEATRIESVARNAQTPSVFNLSGQQLALPQKGINVIGGKKVVVK